MPADVVSRISQRHLKILNQIYSLAYALLFLPETVPVALGLGFLYGGSFASVSCRLCTS